MEYSEPELVLPAVKLLAARADGLTTTELSGLLREELQPTGSDLDILQDRTDDRFSQKVRNLTGSHKTLENRGLAVEDKGRYKITQDGAQFLYEHGAISEAISNQGFSADEREKAAEAGYENLVVEEGAVQRLPQKVYKRSRKLTEYARKHFADEDGKIVCVGCGFEGSNSYDEKGSGLIDIHHLHPLHLSDGEGEEKSLAEALENVAPLCPNCHRLVHRDLEQLMSIEELQQTTALKNGG